MFVLPRFPGVSPVLLCVFLVSPVVAAVDIDAPSGDGSTELRVERPVGAGAATMTLGAPDGSYREIAFAADAPIELEARDVLRWAEFDGEYTWEVRFQPLVARSRADGPSAGSGQIDPAFGSLRVVDGVVHAGRDDTPDFVGEGDTPVLQDVILGDLTVRDSLCVGFDCLDVESFGADTVRLKENNLRIHFEDTSNSGSFPANDWAVVVNDDINGGLNLFAIEDRTAGNRLMTLRAGAPANSLFMNNNGNIGLGTVSPVLDLHVANGNTPGLRLDQTAAGGFTPQVWDVAGNEANFFIRDVTNGSNLPFRIVPGAAENSIYVASSGNVGFGTSSPQARVHVADGDLRVDGSVYQLSSRAVKTDFTSVEPARLLDLLEGIDLGVWRYLAGRDSARHFGPAAEDFHAAFGLGESDERISISDMAGVALGAAQALKRQLDARDGRIESLEARLERLEQALLEDRGPGANGVKP